MLNATFVRQILCTDVVGEIDLSRYEIMIDFQQHVVLVVCSFLRTIRISVTVIRIDSEFQLSNDEEV